MASNIIPIKVWGKSGPNPPRVAIVLEELGLPHEFQPITLAEVKNAEYLAINPNGRLPTIYDPNTDLTLWESGAIIEYLVERYDTARKISFEPHSKEAQLARQPMQACWFKKFHPERVPSAMERYVKEINRVTGVVNEFLSKQETGEGGPWLVGGRVSFADLAWASWQITVTKFIQEEDGYDVNNFPVVKDWLDRMLAREPVRKVIEEARKL
ncbi:hypothetical protein Asppvi_001738 [Aspergillus pseudoviridinutans]|uniref:Glutathione S-transferase n=1 Tax=Aspergillus pseudoviridinutans TaxID=1517512 RepID=A0A9P3B5M0_9EURO|nr:uncharacterized protein Asppvi_001738 [Aspergillus pseudoviridinutans]GIJ83218.1 hypothetical protein Asppvi_001738 [Aspergillus pseudoviridinutans]